MNRTQPVETILENTTAAPHTSMGSCCGIRQNSHSSSSGKNRFCGNKATLQ